MRYSKIEIKLMLKAHCNNENDGNNKKNDTHDSTAATTLPSFKRHHTPSKIVITTGRFCHYWINRHNALEKGTFKRWMK